MYVIGQCGIVGQDDVVVQLVVMCQVDIGYDLVVIVDVGCFVILYGILVEGDEFVDGVVVVDFYGGGFVGVFFVLWCGVDGGELENFVVMVNGGVVFDYYVGIDVCVCVDVYVRIDDGICVNFD